ncbi:MAG: S1 RNA-binding domain-containing protein [Thermoprotei archaeon]
MSVTLGSEWPSQGELVIAVVTDILDHGAYVKIESHSGKRGYLPISEISQGWVTDIRKFINPGQRVVLRAIRVNPQRGQIDLSLKRVTPSERNVMMKAWKRKRKFFKIMEEFFGEIKLQAEDKTKILNVFMSNPDPLSILEKAATEGSTTLENLGLDSSISQKLAEYAKRIVKVKEYSGKLEFQLQTTKKGGANLIREALIELETFLNSRNVRARVYVVASPRYACEVVSEKPKTINNLLKEIPVKLKDIATKLGLELTLDS